MRKNRSPWIHQLSQDRASNRLSSDLETDVVIVGAGIAGISSAFFTLKYTNKRVVMLEKYKLAHGATGHNAGLIVGYFEVGFSRMVEMFGLTLAAEGQKEIDLAWSLLDEMYTEAKVSIPFSRFLIHNGLVREEHLLHELEHNYLRRAAGIDTEHVTVATSAPYIDRIPKKYDGLWRAMPPAHLRELLETHNPKYTAVMSEPGGVMNSALFCERVLGYLLEKYPTRFTLYEHAPVHKIILRGNGALLDAGTHTVKAGRVVLCTNGFENFHIINEHGLEIDARYHASVRGVIGFMSGYLASPEKPPGAFCYFSEKHQTPEDSYIYMTRRPYEMEKGMEHNLVSIGGPEVNLPEAREYIRDTEYPEQASQEIQQFVDEVLEPGTETREYIFQWHGLMGYTENGIRMVGEEPQNPVLLYNLGCNGVGILPSIFGGRKIARHLAGEKVPPSIFDIPKRIAKPSPVKVSNKPATK